jgi:hypothetical protein
MKSIITLTVISVLALGLAGCNQNSATDSTDAPATNSSMSGSSGVSTNLPVTNSPPNLHTNLASNNP